MKFKNPQHRRKSKAVKEKTLLPDMVPHPRYGVRPVPTILGCRLPSEDVRGGYWGYHSETIFPQTAIEADTAKQNFTTFPRKYYVDILKECQKCRLPFMFFAREQQYWYETLGFYIDVDCIHCPKCRKSNQQLKRRFQRYSELVVKKEWSDVELIALIGDAVFLFEAGLLKDKQRLRRWKNLVKRRFPDHEDTMRLETLISTWSE